MIAGNTLVDFAAVWSEQVRGRVLGWVSSGAMQEVFGIHECKWKNAKNASQWQAHPEQ